MSARGQDRPERLDRGRPSPLRRTTPRACPNWLPPCADPTRTPVQYIHNPANPRRLQLVRGAEGEGAGGPVRPARGSPTCPTARGLGYATSIRTAAARKLVEIARANLQRWLGTSRNAALLEWRRLLDTLPSALRRAGARRRGGTSFSRRADLPVRVDERRHPRAAALPVRDRHRHQQRERQPPPPGVLRRSRQHGRP